MSLPAIQLISIGSPDQQMLGDLLKVVGHEYDTPVNLKNIYLDLNPFFDASRKQYNGNLLLREIEQKHATEDTKTIGLFAVDLYIPILTYIFGQAYLNGRSGIASMYRLSNERYGLPRDMGVLKQRFAKEIIHELGHAYGLIHCHTPRCVMQSSTYVEDIDQKKTALCPDCREKLGLIAIKPG